MSKCWEWTVVVNTKEGYRPKNKYFYEEREIKALLAAEARRFQSHIENTLVLPANQSFIYFDESDKTRIQVVASIFQGPPPAIVIPPNPAPKPKAVPKRPSLSLDDITKSITEQEADNIEHSELEVTSYSPPPVKQDPPDIADLLVESIAKDNTKFYPKPLFEVPDGVMGAELDEFEENYVPEDQIVWEDPATEEARRSIASGPRPKPKYFVYKKADLFRYYMEKGDLKRSAVLRSPFSI